jgi:hypothetical protein
VGALLPGCGATVPPPQPLDVDTYDLKKPGVTCMRGLRHDEVKGCMLGVAPGEAELRVVALDDMSPAFRLVSALYLLDCHLVHLWNEGGEAAVAVPADPRGPDTATSAAPPAGEAGKVESPRSGAPDEEGTAGKAARAEPRKELPIFDVAVPAGAHELRVRLQYQGNGFGVFAYLKGYKFDVRSSHSIIAPPGELTVVTVVGHEKGGVTTPLEERPAVRWIESR